MNIKVPRPDTTPYGYPDYGHSDSKPFRYLMLHAKGIPLGKAWPSPGHSLKAINAFHIIPIREDQVKTSLSGMQVNMNSIKTRRELTDSIPIAELTRHVLEAWVRELTSWELVGWVQEAQDYSLGQENVAEYAQLTIVVKVQTNKAGDFVYPSVTQGPCLGWVVVFGLLVIWLLYKFW
ncbi:hypothetical protein FS749_009874 [Ceratobasidium sp. UAMH 11750]|nr:hypothetical protein FS749_009874 [Ceratobasidium sp. UAMH 11750]